MTFRALCIPVRLRRKNYNKVYGKCLIFLCVLFGVTHSHKQECIVAETNNYLDKKLKSYLQPQLDIKRRLHNLIIVVYII